PAAAPLRGTRAIPRRRASALLEENERPPAPAPRAPSDTSAETKLQPPQSLWRARKKRRSGRIAEAICRAGRCVRRAAGERNRQPWVAGPAEEGTGRRQAPSPGHYGVRATPLPPARQPSRSASR